MKKIIPWILLVILVWIAVIAGKPFWDRYSIQMDVNAAAIYGTKNSIEETRLYLTRRMAEKDRGFVGEDFFIEKDEKNTTTVGLVYEDAIGFFGYDIYVLTFKVESTVEEVAEMM